jgi:hypothetical protein
MPAHFFAHGRRRKRWCLLRSLQGKLLAHMRRVRQAHEPERLPHPGVPEHADVVRLGQLGDDRLPHLTAMSHLLDPYAYQLAVAGGEENRSFGGSPLAQ